MATCMVTHIFRKKSHTPKNNVGKLSLAITVVVSRCVRKSGVGVIVTTVLSTSSGIDVYDTFSLSSFEPVLVDRNKRENISEQYRPPTILSCESVVTATSCDGRDVTCELPNVESGSHAADDEGPPDSAAPCHLTFIARFGMHTPLMHANSGLHVATNQSDSSYINSRKLIISGSESIPTIMFGILMLWCLVLSCQVNATAMQVAN
jgi:hypothetical protein